MTETNTQHLWDRLSKLSQAKRARIPPLLRPVYDILRETSMFGYNNWYWAGHPHRLAATCLTHVRWFFQRGRVGYADIDWWNLDSYLSRVISLALKDLRDRGVTYPTGSTPKEWREELSVMIAAFETHSQLVESSLVLPEEERLLLKTSFDQGWKLMGERFENLWD